jgi:hypothetical protein
MLSWAGSAMGDLFASGRLSLHGRGQCATFEGLCHEKDSALSSAARLELGWLSRNIISTG